MCLFYYCYARVDNIVDITCAGVNITLSDLSNYRVRVYAALSMSLRSGYVIHTLGAPSSGAVLAFMLRVIEGRSFNFVSAVNAARRRHIRRPSW